MFGRRGEEPQPTGWEPLPTGQVRDPEAMADSAPDPDQDGDDQYW